MKCPRCNTELVDDARFCGVCGAPLALPQENATLTMPTAVVPGNNEATIMADSWPGAQPMRSPQGSQAFPQPPVYAAPTASQTPEPAPPWLQQPQAANGSSFTQPPNAYRPGMAPGTMSSAGVIAPPIKRKRRRGRRILLGFFLSLVLVLAVLVGAWFIGVRPYLHNMVQTQLDQALDSAENEIVLFQAVLPPGGQVVHVDENSINNYLDGRDISPLQNLHATITPDGLRLDFSAYNFNCAIIVVPVAVGGGLQVQNVQVQGVLWLVMSNDELTTALNNNFQSFGHQLTRKIQAITLHEHEMDVQMQ